MIISFGVFQTYYVSTFDLPRSDIAWIGSLAVFLLFFTGIISGRLTDAGYLHLTTFTGAVLVVLGTFLTSLTESYWQILLAQGLCTGLGNGLLLTPTMTLLTTYFRRRLPLVMGIVACGSTTGGLVYPSMARTLLPKIGFGWTLRAMGFVQLGTFAISLACGKSKRVSRKKAPLLDLAVFKDPVFTLYTVGSFLVSQPLDYVLLLLTESQAYLGVFFPFFFLSSFARERLEVTYTQSLDLTLFLNGIGFVGRLLPSLIARYMGTMNVFVSFVFTSALCMYTWIPVDSTSGLYVWTTLYSLSVGGVQSLFMAVVPVVNSDPSKIGARMGIVSAAVGIGALIGSPVSGAIIASSNGSYVGAQVFSGTTLLVGGMVVLASRETKRRQDQKIFWSKM
jgi:MFS family permease